MQDPFRAPVDRRRPQVSSPLKVLLLLLVLFFFGILIEGLHFQFYVQDHSCPQSTFEHGLLHVGAAYVSSGIIFVLAWTMLLLSTILRFQRWSDKEDYSDSDRSRRRKISIPVFIASLFGMAAAGLLWVNTVTCYFCTTADNIVIRSGLLDTPHTLAWDNVDVVYASCATSKYGKYGIVKLAFRNGEEVGLGLSAARGNLLNDYKMIRQSLKGGHYRYYVNATVSPAMCSPEVYRLLWEWLNVS